MNELLKWGPLLWTARITMTIILVIASALVIAFGWKMLWGGGRKFGKFSGTMELFGQKLAVNAELDSERDKQLANLESRLGTIEEGFDSLSKSVGSVITEIRTLKEDQNVTRVEERRTATEGGEGALEQGDRPSE